MNHLISKQHVTIAIADSSNRVHSPYDGNVASTSIKKIAFEFDKACVISGVSLCCGFGKTALSTGSLSCFSRIKAFSSSCCFFTSIKGELIAEHLQSAKNPDTQKNSSRRGGGGVRVCLCV